MGGKESTCNAGEAGSIPGSGRSPGGGDGNPLQYSCMENSVNRGAWQTTAHRSHRVDKTETHTHTHRVTKTHKLEEVPKNSSAIGSFQGAPLIRMAPETSSVEVFSSCLPPLRETEVNLSWLYIYIYLGVEYQGERVAFPSFGNHSIILSPFI